MVSVYPIRGILYISWTEKDNNGRMVRTTRSLKLKNTRANRKIAESEKRDRMRQLQLNPVLKRHRYYLNDAVQDFLKTKSGANYTNFRVALDYLVNVYGENTYTRDISTLQTFYDYLQGKTNNNIKNEEKQRNIAVNTIASYMRNARIFFNWLFAKKYISEKPVFPRIRRARTRRRSCPASIVVQVLDFLKAKDKRYEHQYLSILILFLTGMRAGELCRLRWEDIDFVNNIIYVNNTKSLEDNQFIPLIPTAKLMLMPYKKRAGKIVPYETYDSMEFWGRALKKLNLEHYGLHSIRKSVANLLERVDASDKVIQDTLRHQKFETTVENYLSSEIKERSYYLELALGGYFKKAG